MSIRGGPVPTYQYACTECTHSFEQFQSFTDDALTVCPVCEGRLRKVFNAVGVVFKGSGFYRNDSRTDGKSTGNGSAPKTPATSDSSGTSGSDASVPDKSSSSSSDTSSSEKAPASSSKSSDTTSAA
jgi:putative FmdB family regulatory protein